MSAPVHACAASVVQKHYDRRARRGAGQCSFLDTLAALRMRSPVRVPSGQAFWPYRSPDLSGHLYLSSSLLRTFFFLTGQRAV